MEVTTLKLSVTGATHDELVVDSNNPRPRKQRRLVGQMAMGQPLGARTHSRSSNFVAQGKEQRMSTNVSLEHLIVGATGVGYLIVGVLQGSKGEISNGMIWTGYAFAQIGLWLNIR